jgi:hypothetical protein
MIKILKTGHPRLFIDPEVVKGMKELEKNDAFFKELKAGLIQKANSLLDEKPVAFKITGPRMLKNCQEIHSRVATLSLAYLLDKDMKYATRAKDELLNAANYPHWNKDHFLDTAELITAFAIGYDWLYEALQKSELEIIKNAMISKGIQVGVEEHKNNIWWAGHKYNWNQVCNGGMIIGALAVADEEPKLCDEVFNATTKHLPVAFNSFGKEGGWEAGPDYWQYTAWYSALLLEVLQKVTGNDFGLSKTEGFDKTGLFPIYSAGPNDKYFNFADADEDYNSLPTLFWLGKQFKIDACINENHRLLRKDIVNKADFDAFNLVWYAPLKKDAQPLPASFAFRDINAAYMRGKWGDKESTFVAIKGGFNQADHAHLDLGTFVLDMQGIRWASDLGRDNYDLPNYFDLSEGGGRWKYFRLNTKSHNTLVLNNDIQRATAKAAIKSFETTADATIVVIDLTEAYVPHAKSVTRTVKFIGGQEIIIEDKIEWAGTQKLARWQMLTDAEISLSASGAELRKGGKKINVSLLEPSGSKFEVVSAAQAEPEKPNKGFSQLFVQKSETENTTKITVSIKNL